MADEIKSSPEIVNEITSPLVGLEEGIDKPLQASIKKMSGMTGPSQGATVTRDLPKKAQEATKMSQKAAKEVRKMAGLMDDQDKVLKVAINIALGGINAITTIATKNAPRTKYNK